MPPELSPDAFAVLARAAGLTASPEHLETLRPEVEAMLGRIAPLNDLPVDDIPVERAIRGVE